VNLLLHCTWLLYSATTKVSSYINSIATVADGNITNYCDIDTLRYAFCKSQKKTVFVKCCQSQEQTEGILQTGKAKAVLDYQKNQEQKKEPHVPIQRLVMTLSQRKKRQPRVLIITLSQR
jgi:hypothetical protein